MLAIYLISHQGVEGPSLRTMDSEVGFRFFVI